MNKLITLLILGVLASLSSTCFYEEPVVYDTDAALPVAVSVSINNGADNTTNTSVTLTLSATDDVGVTHYYASESPAAPSVSSGGWQTYSTSVSFTLTDANISGTYPRTVYVWFKDASGKMSSSVNDSINYIKDTTAPTATSVSIDGGAASTSSTSVTLTLSATDNIAVTDYYASESSSTPTASAAGWSSYATSASFTLSSASGAGTYPRTVYVWFKDGAGNVSSSVSDAINLIISDVTLPTANSISINSGAGSTTNTSVTLTLSATDDVGVTHYYASESASTPAANASGWASYSTSVSYTFDSSTSETKTVYVWFKDAAGNVSGSMSDSIVTNIDNWPIQFGTAEDDYVVSVKTASDGTIYIAGKTKGSLYNNINSGGEELFVSKYDSDGNRLWTTQIGSLVNPYGVSMEIDTNENIYVAGDTAGSFDAHPNVGSSDIFLVKFDSDGIKSWSTTLSSTSRQLFDDIALDNNGFIYLTGATTGTLDGITPSSKQDSFLVKYKSDGQKVWTALDTSIDSNDMHPRAIATDSNGDIYFAGSGAPNFNQLGDRDIFVGKYSRLDGSRIWTQQITTGGQGDAKSGTILVDADDNVYFAGTATGALAGFTNSGYYDAVIFKYDSNGNLLWKNQIGTTGEDSFSGINADNSGNLFLVGTTYGELSSNQNNGGSDVLVYKFENTGQILWNKQLGTSANDRATDISYFSDTSIYITGVTAGNLDNRTNSGGWDGFIIKINNEGVVQ